jgi:hypothetical protein
MYRKTIQRYQINELIKSGCKIFIQLWVKPYSEKDILFVFWIFL